MSWFRRVVAAGSVLSAYLVYKDTPRCHGNTYNGNHGNTSLLDHLPFVYKAACRENERSFDFIADATEIALPAVVSISMKRQHRFLVQEEGSGSGFIVDKRGYIITNEHVVAGYREVEVTLPDGTKLHGRVVSVDPHTDLALVKVESSTELPEIVLGDEENLRPGQWAIAIGNSLDFPNTVTVGIISNVSRDITQRLNINTFNSNYKIGRSNYIQTDAAINPGNSGGPLVNLKGEVIAVNTISLQGQQVNGVSFSIPVSEVKRFFKQFSEGDVNSPDLKTRYSLGIQVVSLTNEMARYLHANSKLDRDIDCGVFVYAVVKNSPAHDIGLQKGDVIFLVNSIRVRSRGDLTAALKKFPEQPVNISFYRPDVGILVARITPISTK